MVKQKCKKYLNVEVWARRPGCSTEIPPRLRRCRSRIARSSGTEDRSKSAQAVKIHKIVPPNTNEESAATVVPDEKNKGRENTRKRKADSDILFKNADVLPYKTISVGDKLKVYDGPNQEAKQTSYEAKVICTIEENGETMYFVHYTGWNTRYDEWISASRVADNLSWAARKASKKQALDSTPKDSKKDKTSGKKEIIEGECQICGYKEASGSSFSSSSVSSKDNQSNRQGSVAQSTTPSSSSRSKSTTSHKRPTTRASQSKRDDEAAQDSESDSGSELEDTKNFNQINSDNAESDSAVLSRGKELETSLSYEILSDARISIKEEDDDDAQNAGVKEIKIEINDSHECVRDSGFNGESQSQDYQKDKSTESTPTIPALTDSAKNLSSKTPVDLQMDDTSPESTPTIPAPTDSAKNLSSETPVDLQMDDTSPESTPTIPAPTDSAKNLSSETPVDLQMDDTSPESTPTIPAPTDSAKNLSSETPVDLQMDDTSPESTPMIQTCEETFDKICAPLLRAAVLDSRHIAFLEHLENYEDDDNFDDDSEDRLVISERDSDNSNTSFDKDSELLSPEYSNSATEVNDSKTSPHQPPTKDMFPKDTDNEGHNEEMEDISGVIPTVVKVEASQDSSDEETIANEENAVSTPEIESVNMEVNDSKTSPHQPPTKDMFPKDTDNEGHNEEMEDISGVIPTVVKVEASQDSSDEETIANEENAVSTPEIESVNMEVNDSKTSPHQPPTKDMFPKDTDNEGHNEEMEDISSVIPTVVKVEASQDSSDEETIANEENAVSTPEIESVNMEGNDGGSDNNAPENLALKEEETEEDDLGTERSPPHATENHDENGDNQFLLSLLPFLYDVPKQRKLFLRQKIMSDVMEELQNKDSAPAKYSSNASSSHC